MFFIRIALTLFIGCNFIQITCAARDNFTLILDRNEKITATKAFDCYKQYESELKNKTQKELNTCLAQICTKSTPKIMQLRPKLVALMFAGAQFTNDGLTISRFVDSNDLPLVQFALERRLLDPNYVDRYERIPIIWKCKNVAIAKLLIQHGAAITNKLPGYRNIVHFLCAFRNNETTNFIQLYHSLHPELIYELNENGRTPLVSFSTHNFGLKPCSPNISDKTLRRDILIAYTLINLGGIRACQDKVTHTIIAGRAAKTYDTQLKHELRKLAAYMQRPTDFRSSLFQRLIDVWHNKLDA